MTPSITMNTLLWFLVIQALLGAYDTFWNHEWKEKLPYQISARLEQRIHAIRELVYAILFMGLAWFTWGGQFAWLLLGLLIFETSITAWDFVEEDRSRKLSAQERVTHFILTLNYGAFIALILPHILQWSALENEMILQPLRRVSLVLTLFAIAVLMLGIRNWLSANKLNALHLESKAGD